MQDIMVDLETTGTSPDRAAIIQIAAVRFDLKTRKIDGDSMFDRCLNIPAWRFWEEDCRAWWAKNPPHILQGIYTRMEDPAKVMQDFADWIGYQQPVRMWAKPISFEWPFIQGYFRDFRVHSPLNYRTAMDCRPYISGLSRGEEELVIKDSDIPFEGDAHNALFDVLHQIKWLFLNEDEFNPRPEVEQAA